MKVYIDISEFMKIDAITGIQRVMREILVRILENKTFETVLMSYSERMLNYLIIDNKKFLACFAEEIGDKEDIYSNQFLKIEELEAGSVFFDLDVSWSATLKRSYLLPILKSRGVRIVAQIYDIMAITHFQYFTMHFTYTFMEFIGAHLKYADLIIVSTKASLNILEDFAKKANLGTINGIVAYLGADFKENVKTTIDVQKNVRNIVHQGKYILMVGTMEPRKNHKLVLDAYDKGINKLNLNIVFAGRVGWIDKEFLDNMHNHKMYQKKIFHIDSASNTDIDYLYKNAYIVAFPTHMEGFGLPLVEALERGTPVVATDIDVLKEIGQDYCDYFAHDDVEKFVQCVKKLKENADYYKQKKDRLSLYKPVTWDESAQIMINAILTMGEENYEL